MFNPHNFISKLDQILHAMYKDFNKPTLIYR